MKVLAACAWLLVAVAVVSGVAVNGAAVTGVDNIPAMVKLPVSSQIQRAATLKVLTYNFFQIPFGAKYRWERREAFCEYIGGMATDDAYDVIAFQELFGSGRQRHIMHCLRQYGFEYHAKGPGSFISWWYPWKFLDSGLLLLSKFPIIESRLHVYKHGVNVDKYASKGAVYAKLDVGGDLHVHIVTTHLQASYNSAALDDETTIARLNQLAELKEFIDEQACPANEPLLLAGDLNVDAVEPFVDSNGKSEYWRTMTLLNENLPPGYPKWKDLYLDTNGVHTITFGHGNYLQSKCNSDDIDPLQSIDYFLCRGCTKEVSVKLDMVDSVPDRYQHALTRLSDHYGLSLTMGLDGYH